MSTNGRCTGPRTADGLARSSQNSLRHGLRAEAPVLPWEDAAGWEEHRAAVVSSLDPAPGAEQALAAQVATILWRMGRVIAFERARAVTNGGDNGVGNSGSPSHLAQTSVTAAEAGLATSEAALAVVRDIKAGRDGNVAGLAAVHVIQGFDEGLLDSDHLARLGVPEAHREVPERWDGWALGMLRLAAEQAAARAGVTLAEVLDEAAVVHEKNREGYAARARRAREQLHLAEEGTRATTVVRSMDPRGVELVCRYEAHLSRTLHSTFSLLYRLQAARTGHPVPVPLGVDVVVHAGAAAS